MSTSSNDYIDFFARAKNLFPLWPHDAVSEVHTSIMATAEAGFAVSIPKVGKDKKKGKGKKTKKNMDVQLLSTLDNDKEAVLASFPHRYAGALSVIVSKWNYYFRVYEALREIEVEPESDKEKWKGNLLDYWGRTVLFIERVLEVAIQ